MDTDGAVQAFVEITKDWDWWKVIIAGTIFIVAIRSPAIITALSAYKKLRIEGDHQRRVLEERIVARREKAKRKLKRKSESTGKGGG